MTMTDLAGAPSGAIAPLLGGWMMDFFAGRHFALSLQWSNPLNQFSVHVLSIQGLDFVFLISAAAGLAASQWLALINEPGGLARFCWSLRKNYPCLSAAPVLLLLWEKMISSVSERCGADLLAAICPYREQTMAANSADSDSRQNRCWWVLMVAVLSGSRFSSVAGTFYRDLTGSITPCLNRLRWPCWEAVCLVLVQLRRKLM
jgi:hypothetical protein